MFNSQLTSIGRLFSIEMKKLAKGNGIYIVILLLLALVGFFASVPANSYRSRVAGQEHLIQDIIEKIEAGFPMTVAAWPEGYDPADYPLVDAVGNVILENAEIYKRFVREHLGGQIAEFTAPDSQYSFSSLIFQGARQGAGILAILGLATAISLFAGDFNSGSYRLLISRGAKRSHIVTAKSLTAGLLAISFSIIATITVLITLRLLYAGFGAVHPAIISVGEIWDVFWIFTLIALAYMALGGLFGIFLASPSSAMAAGLVWGFLSVGFFSVTPGGDGLLSTISPVTIGYNIGSLMHNAWPGAGLISTISAGEESYRTTGLALILLLAYPVIFTGLIYAMFNRKELKE